LSAILLGVAILTALAQRDFIAAVSSRDAVRSRLAERSAGLHPELSTMSAFRDDATYYLRQLGRRQPQPDIERKRLVALGGVALALACLGWLVWSPS
jgi:hypothetical protein